MSATPRRSGSLAEAPARAGPRAPSSPSPDREAFLRDALAGLSSSPKRLSCKYLYDERGSALFEAICEVPEYYLTRAELALLARHGPAIGAEVGPGAAVVELGSGSAVKTRRLLAALEDPVAYVPVEISPAALAASAARHRAAFPDVPVHPLRADFTRALSLPDAVREAGRVLVFFPGSTIGNFSRGDAVALLSRLAALIGPDGALLVGVDLQKDVAVMEAAYNDSAGVTARFNGNLLVRLRDELGADIDPDAFEHRSVWDGSTSAIESYLVSRREQVVTLAGRRFPFAAGEAIHTESSHKYTLHDFAALAARAGLRRAATWFDERRLFSAQLFRTA